MADGVRPHAYSSCPARPGHQYGHTYIGQGGKGQLGDTFNIFRELPLDPR